ncbi:helix-turn-helix domain-containing protein [Hoeflea poritis]|uniref:HTH cro/C1-type domain-containing protein n=1 Tax=Hoeflea poritis TaxID=2993659 RepID=A0ABT4VMM5_9HYPH|nr:hypothetical protein [Hoeflea poritis]MDA4845924.1 hypothetical protein [Hoeflea poritis]
MSNEKNQSVARPNLMADYPSELGDRLLLLRLAMGFDQQRAFATQCDIEPADFNKYEKGRRSLPSGAALKIRRRWHVSLDWLYLGSDAGMAWEVREKLLAALTDFQGKSA